MSFLLSQRLRSTLVKIHVWLPSSLHVSVKSSNFKIVWEAAELFPSVGHSVDGAGSRETHHSHLIPAGKEEETGSSRKLGIMGRKLMFNYLNVGTEAEWQSGEACWTGRQRNKWAGDVTRSVSVHLSCLIPVFTNHTRKFVSCNFRKNATERDF